MKITKYNLKILFIAWIFSLLFASKSFADCRFWAAITDKAIPENVVLDGLLDSDNSLCNLSKNNQDGWGIGCYYNKETKLLKGAIPAYQDSEYRQSVLTVSKLKPSIVVSHIRKATSGCRGGVPNPHPFARNAKGKDWFFGHNGTVGKKILISLIGESYLDKNQPNTCTYDPPDSWVDSELYFIFILKNIEEAQGDVVTGIKNTLTKLRSELEGNNKGLNFFLTDGDTLWAFRFGRTLYYYWNPEEKYAIVASMYTSSEKGDWVEVLEGSLVVMEKGLAPKVLDIYAPVASAN